MADDLKSLEDADGGEAEQLTHSGRTLKSLLQWAPDGNQLIDKRGENYLREVACPEDYPDEQDWEEANKIIEKEKKSSDSSNQ